MRKCICISYVFLLSLLVGCVAGESVSYVEPSSDEIAEIHIGEQIGQKYEKKLKCTSDIGTEYDVSIGFKTRSVMPIDSETDEPYYKIIYMKSIMLDNTEAQKQEILDKLFDSPIYSYEEEDRTRDSLMYAIKKRKNAGIEDDVLKRFEQLISSAPDAWIEAQDFSGRLYAGEIDGHMYVARFIDPEYDTDYDTSILQITREELFTFDWRDHDKDFKGESITLEKCDEITKDFCLRLDMDYIFRSSEKPVYASDKLIYQCYFQGFQAQGKQYNGISAVVDSDGIREIEFCELDTFLTEETPKKLCPLEDIYSAITDIVTANPGIYENGYINSMIYSSYTSTADGIRTYTPCWSINEGVLIISAIDGRKLN